MDYRTMQKSPWYRVVTLFVYIFCIVTGAIGQNPLLVVLGLAGLALLAVPVASRRSSLSRNPTRSEAAAYVSARPVRYIGGAGVITVALLVGGAFAYRSGVQREVVGNEVSGGVLIAIGLLGLWMTIRIALLVRRERSTTSGET